MTQVEEPEVIETTDSVEAPLPAVMYDVRTSVDNDIDTLVRKDTAQIGGLADSPLRYLPEIQRNQLYKWLCDQLQNEREGWKRRVDAALKEIERHRKSALVTEGLLQDIRERTIRVLHQAGCDFNANTISIEEILSKVCDIASFLIEDQSRCYTMLVPNRNVESRTLSLILGEKMDDMKAEIANIKAEIDRTRSQSESKQSNDRPENEDRVEMERTSEKETSNIEDSNAKDKLVLTKEKSTIVKNTVFTFDKMSLRMLVDGSQDSPMNRAKRFHELENRIELLQEKIRTLETELDRRSREILKYKSNIRMLKRMYHYDNSLNNGNNNNNATLNGLNNRRKDSQPQNNINGLSIVKASNSREDETASVSTDDIAALGPFSNARTSVSRCLRCQRLYRLQDNHKMACHYHPKAKKKFEKYTSSGRLINVVFIWDCCKKEGDQDGCCTDQHI